MWGSAVALCEAVRARGEHYSAVVSGACPRSSARSHAALAASMTGSALGAAAAAPSTRRWRVAPRSSRTYTRKF